MKNGKRPSWNQRKLIEEWGLNPLDWLVVKDTPEQMVLVNRYSDQSIKTIPKGETT